MKLGWLSDDGFREALIEAVRTGQLIPVSSAEPGARTWAPDGMVARNFMYREDWAQSEAERLKRELAAMRLRVDEMRQAFPFPDLTELPFDN